MRRVAQQGHLTMVALQSHLMTVLIALQSDIMMEAFQVEVIMKRYSTVMSILLLYKNKQIVNIYVIYNCRKGTVLANTC
jgi:hypothetical protein